MSDQLDIFHQPPPDTEPEPDAPRCSQISVLPGESFEDIFVRDEAA